MSEKANKSKEAQTNYAEHDIVLAKVRGYPPWPGIVVNPDSVPPRVAKERPTDKKTVYHCVRFFVAEDFGWVASKEISRLNEHEIRAYIEPHKRNSDLLAAYRNALDHVTWEKEREKVTLAAPKQEDNAPVDQLETEDEDKKEKEKKLVKSKKRGRNVEGPSAKPKAKPKPKTEKKTTTGRSKKDGAKSREIESEDDGDQEAEAEGERAGTSAKAIPPPSKKFKQGKR